MGLDQKDFVKAFVMALSNEAVLEKLENTICGGLKVEIDNLTTTHRPTELVKKLVVQASNEELKRQVDNLNNTIKKKEGTIIELEQSVKKIENKLDDHEQYRRRNSIKVSGIKESENEDIGERVLNLFNNRMKLKPPVTAEQIDRVQRTGVI